MRNQHWSIQLGRWLPREAEQDLYQPALSDLRVDALRRQRREPARLAVLWLYGECLRLVVIEWFRSIASPAPSQTARPRKEWIAMFSRDVRHALRIFRREPAFAAAAVLTLTLGIGANTALFAVIEAVLLRPLPYSAAGDLLIVKHRDVGTGISKQDMAIGDFIDLRARQQSLEALAGYGGFQSTLIGAGDPVRIEGLGVTPDVFAALRVQPAMGRVFAAEDAREGSAPVVIVSHQLWSTELGSDPNILSRSLQIGTTRRLVVGVAPPGFRFAPSEQTDVLVPLRVPESAPATRKAGWIYGLGRLRPGVTRERAEAELATLSQQLEREFPQQNQGSLYITLSLRDALLGDTKRPLLLLLAAVGFVLLIACANVGNLLLARSLGRQQELAMRLALGAARSRLVMQILTEGVVLALAGGLIGIALAWWAAPALASLVPQRTPIPGLERVGLNMWVLAFSVVASLLSALMFGAVACLGLTREGARGALAGQRRVTMTAGARRAASSLVVAEIALAVVLLIAAGLTLRSFANLISVDPGFTPRGVITMQIGLPQGRYADAERGGWGDTVLGSVPRSLFFVPFVLRSSFFVPNCPNADTARASTNAFVAGRAERRAIFAGMSIAAGPMRGACGIRPAIRMACDLEKSVDHPRGHAGARSGHWRDDDDFRAAECGAAPAVAVSGFRTAGRSLGQRAA